MNTAQRRELARESAKWPRALVEIPRDQWPPLLQAVKRAPSRVLRSRLFLVQEWDDAPAPAFARLTINRVVATAYGWADGITWDELQRVKSECGYINTWAVEIYPPVGAVVNDANMRHLWLLTEPPPFAWKASGND